MSYRKTSPLRSAISGLSLTFLLAGPAAFAQTTSWDVPGGGAFDEPANWTEGVPTAGGTAVFSNSAVGTITLEQNMSLGLFQVINNTNGNLIFDFSGSTLTGSGNFVLNTGSTNSAVTINGGTFNFSGTSSRLLDGSGNTVTITGAGTELNLNGTFRNAGAGNSTLLIEDGAKVTYSTESDGRITGANNTITITDSGSVLKHGGEMRFGWNASGATLNVENAGRLEIGGTLRIGDFNTATPTTDTTLTVTGTNSVAQTGGLRMRGYGGEVNVLNGGTLTSTGALLIGESTGVEGNVVLVSGANSSLTGASVSLGGGVDAVDSVLRVSDNASAVITGVSTVGSESTSTGNLLHVATGGTYSTERVDLLNNAELRLEGGTITTTATSGAQGVRLSANNSLISGYGTIHGDVYAIGDEGSRQVRLGFAGNENEHNFGIITAYGQWNNTGIDIYLNLGDFSDNTAVAGENFDQILVIGDFTAGGTLQLNFDEFVAGDEPQSLRLLGWETFSGDEGDLEIVGFDPSYGTLQFGSDGLYLTTVPEPGAVALICGVLALLLVARRFR